jgi:hypothetical protein
MAADVNTLTPVLRKTISDYQQCSELEIATIAIANTLYVSPREQQKEQAVSKYSPTI